MQIEPQLVSVSDAARILAIGKTKTYELLAAGALQSVSIGTRKLVKLSSIKAVAVGGAS